MKIFHLTYITFFCFNLGAQSIPKSVIVNLVPDAIQAFVDQLPAEDRTANIKILSADLDIIKIEASEAAIKYISHSPLVESWGADHEILLRGKPNDPRYNDQWSHRLIKTEKAWDNNTGGKFDSKHDIVIAVLDEGFDVTHPELVSNSFTNDSEIPNNGIDDDLNGYIDDYIGLNIETLNDQHPIDIHGTAVSGIIGAKGNNADGLTGVMWDVKMLYFSEVNRQSELIEVFQYIVDLRRKWNESEGEEGALIVATNYSAGIDNAFGSDPEYKSWCDMYDLLGEVGILSTGATTNSNTNVDANGDMPTTCPSNYLLSVTSVGSDDNKIIGAGYGAVHIDIGAPGGGNSDPLSALGLDGGYKSFSGTSGATPHVTGTIGLLYGVECLEFKNEIYNSPASAALRVRNAIFNSVDFNSTLQDKTATNGRLNINKAIEKLIETCDGDNADNLISKITYDDTNFYVNYTRPAGESPELMITDRVGRTIYVGAISVLDPNSTGEIKVLRSDINSGIYYFSIHNDMHISTKPVFLTK